VFEIENERKEFQNEMERQQVSDGIELTFFADEIE
jgi:hypothetical protein